MEDDRVLGDDSKLELLVYMLSEVVSGELDGPCAVVICPRPLKTYSPIPLSDDCWLLVDGGEIEGTDELVPSVFDVKKSQDV